MGTSVEIKNTTRRESPRISFARIAQAIFKKGDYELSVVIVGDTLARKLNRSYREKRYAANVLSFPLSPLEGEIFLNIEAAQREAKSFRTTLRSRLALLFVHGCLHLKKMRHGRNMEREEKKILKRFKLE